MMSISPQVSSDWRITAFTGFGVIFAVFGVLGGWSALADIDQAVHAVGSVATEFGRKTVQHLEGGIVKAILVKEGDHVKQGQPLLRLANVQSQANVDLLEKQRDYYRAIEARALAESGGRGVIVWPASFGPRDDDDLKSVLTDQQQQFDEKRQTLIIQTKIIRSRIDQLKTQIDGVSTQINSTAQQTEINKKELADLTSLAEKKLVQRTRLYSMQREQARLEGVAGQLVSEKAKYDEQIGEAEIQIQQMNQKYREDAAAQLSEARQKIAEVAQRISVADDILAREVVNAPRDGTVQNLRVFAPEQVVRGGEPLMEIAPDHEALIVEAQISPNDIDGIQSGKSVEIHFPSFHDRTIPVLLGTLQSVSHDKLVDEATHQPYYRGIVALDRAEIPEKYRDRLRPGMPADVTVTLGERTVLSYLVQPMRESLRKSFTEK
jgi:HlyD family secretion protein